MGARVLAILALCASACTSTAVDPVSACDVFVGAWADYEARCGTLLEPPTGEPADDADRAEVEQLYFGSEGCASATDEDFRDARALRDECPAELATWSCDEPGLPEPCADQIRR